MKNKKLLYLLVGIFVIGIIISSYFLFFYNPYKFQGNDKIKILWINSYHEDFEWSQECFLAFKQVFEQENIDIDFKEIHMNTHIDPSEENMQAKLQEAESLIQEWNPDLIYASDDHAQEIIGKYVNSNIPIVFSGLNREPSYYNYDNAKNVAGVLEKYHLKETIELLQMLDSNIEDIVVVADDFHQWEVVMEQLKKDSLSLDVNFVEWKAFSKVSDFQNYILNAQNNVDAILILPPNTLVDNNNKNVVQLDILKWIIQNSKIPEATFFGIMVSQGILLSVDVSATEQGKEAGTLAKKILLEGDKPSKFEFKATKTGEKNINIKRAEMLGIDIKNIPSTILINSQIYDNFN